MSEEGWEKFMQELTQVVGHSRLTTSGFILVRARLSLRQISASSIVRLVMLL